MNDPIDTHARELMEQTDEEVNQIRAFHEAEDFKWVMSDAKGRRFIWGLLERAGIYRSSFAGDSENTIFNEGGRNQGLAIVDLIHEHCPELYMQMIAEKQDYERQIANIRG